MIRNDSSHISKLKVFLEAYSKYVFETLQPAQREIQKMLDTWQVPHHWAKYQTTNTISIPTPIRSAFTRIKRPEQVVDKIFRKAHLFPAGLEPQSFLRMYDALGVRVVVYFRSHLPLIDQELRNSEFVEIVTDDPPTAYMSADETRILSLDNLKQKMKDSGYRSVHYNLRMKSSNLADDNCPVFEFQLRTAAMDLWSALEHHLGYKPGRRAHTAAKRQLRILSNMLEAIDENFDFLYQELNRFQDRSKWDSEDSLTPENLPPVLNEIGISCAQRDVNNIIKFLISRGVETLGDVLSLATPRRIEIIRNTYLSARGRLPSGLEIIATIAGLRGAESEDEEIQRIKVQIAYNDAWVNMQKEFEGL
jgi:putative GTP pyrophosphokinase